MGWLPWQKRNALDELVAATETAMSELRRRSRELAEVSQVHKLTAQESLHTASRQRDRRKER